VVANQYNALGGREVPVNTKIDWDKVISYIRPTLGEKALAREEASEEEREKYLSLLKASLEQNEEDFAPLFAAWGRNFFMRFFPKENAFGVFLFVWDHGLAHKVVYELYPLDVFREHVYLASEWAKRWGFEAPQRWVKDSPHWNNFVKGFFHLQLKEYELLYKQVLERHGLLSSEGEKLASLAATYRSLAEIFSRFGDRREEMLDVERRWVEAVEKGGADAEAVRVLTQSDPFLAVALLRGNTQENARWEGQ